MDTLVQSIPEAQGDEPRPNKYHFEEFAGFDGERRLKSILRKILPIALYRTWEIFDAAQAPGNDCYLGLVKASEEAERVQKTIRQNILEFQARKLLVLRREVKLLRQSDGTYRHKHVLVKDFTGLYRLAREYYAWTRSEEYIEADRDFAEVILANEYLIKKLRRFNNYRRILMTQVPGPKPQEREEHRWYTEFEEDQTPSQQEAEEAEEDTTDTIRPKQFPKELLKQFPKHSVDRITSKDQIETTSGDSDSSGQAASKKGTVLPFSSPTYSHIAHGAIRSAEEDTNSTELTSTIESYRTTNRSPTEKEMPGAAHAKALEGVSGDRKITSFERTAMQAGVPLALVDEMQAWLQGCPRPEKYPVFIDGILTTFSHQMSNINYLQSNLTQATKLYRYAQHKGYTEDEFRVWLYEAEKRIHRPGPKIANEMGYFFVALKVELLLSIAGSQWPPLPPEPDGHSVEETIISDAAEVTNDQEEVETTSEEPLEACQDDLSHEVEELPASTSSESSALSVRESEQVPASIILCDDPTAGWGSDETAIWWADRLRDRLGKDLYGYETLPTRHGKWGIVFFAYQDPDACEAIVTGAAVTYYMHHGWQPPLQEQS